ncbi:MAG: winged helix-turn-helix domain-containing protein [Terriglobales bacterium]
MPQLKPEVRIVRFGSFEADLREGVLSKAGIRIKLQEQPFQILTLLLQRPGVLVTRDEIRQKLWSEDTFVAFDDGLNTAVRKLRTALSDSADNPRFLETVPRRGYRFVAPVTVADSAGSADPAKQPEASTLGAPVAAEGSSRGKTSRKIWAGVVIAAALVVGLFAVLRDYPGPTYALGETDTVFLADFTNKTGDVAFDDALKQALSISLGQSPFLNILPDHKVNETLKLMGRSVNEKVIGETALEICQRTGSKAVLEGSIASLGAQYVIGLQAINCHTGEVFAQEQVQAARKEDVLRALGDAATRLRQRLGESLGTIQKFDAPLEQATTPSLEALKAYSEGIKIRNQKGSADAIPFLKHAIELDPNFALAYGILSTLYQVLGEDGLGRENALKAYSLRGRVTERENFALTTFYYQFVTGQREEALQNCKLWEETYLQDVTPHICLFFTREMLGRYDEALPEGVQCVAIEPGSGFCYPDLMLDYAVLHRLEDAKATYQQALSHRLDYFDLHTERYNVAFLEGDRAEMGRQAAWASGKTEGEDGMLFAQSATEAFYGRFAKARDLSDRAAESSLRNDQKESAARWQVISALQEAAVGNNERARQQTADGLGYASFEFVQSMAALTQAWIGNSNQAEKIADELASTYPSDTMLHGFWFPAIRATMEINQNRPAKAVELLQPAVSYEMGEHVPLLPAYVRGQAFLALRQGPQAAAEFQKLIDRRTLVGNSVFGALAHLGLGRAYALEAQSSHGADSEAARAKARAAYEDFLALWKNADRDVPILKEAKAEYAKIQ